MGLWWRYEQNDITRKKRRRFLMLPGPRTVGSDEKVCGGGGRVWGKKFLGVRNGTN